MYKPNTSGWNTPLISNSEEIKLGCWNYAAYVFDGSNQKMFLNGKLVAEQTIPNPEICNGAPIRIGAWWQGDPLFFQGGIDEVRIYNRALGIEEIKGIFKL